MNLNMHMSSTLIEYVLICIGRNTIHMYDKYIGPIFIQSSYCQWVMAMLLLDWPLTWKLPGLVVPARGITPAGIVFRVTEVHKPPHHDKVATTGEVFWCFLFYFIYFFQKFFLMFFFFKSSLDPQPLLCGSWFWHPLYQFLVCSLLSSSPLGHIHLINQATVNLCS